MHWGTTTQNNHITAAQLPHQMCAPRMKPELAMPSGQGPAYISTVWMLPITKHMCHDRNSCTMKVQVVQPAVSQHTWQHSTSLRTITTRCDGCNGAPEERWVLTRSSIAGFGQQQRQVVP
jgi:hypothetical protein